MTFGPAGVVTQYVSGLAVPQTVFQRGVGPLNPLRQTLAYSAAPVPNLALGTELVMSIADNVAFVFGVPLNPQTGMRWTLTVRNVSGGAHGAGTFNAVYKGAALPAIANATNRTFEFLFDGTNHVGTFFSAADIPN